VKRDRYGQLLPLGYRTEDARGPAGVYVESDDDSPGELISDETEAGIRRRQWLKAACSGQVWDVLTTQIDFLPTPIDIAITSVTPLP
jgi:hypothetical protein